MGILIMCIEFAAGCASRKSTVQSFHALEKKGQKWHLHGYVVIFGSYMGKEKSLLGEGVTVAVLDTFVAVMAGLIIFPACFLITKYRKPVAKFP